MKIVASFSGIILLLWLMTWSIQVFNERFM